MIQAKELRLNNWVTTDNKFPMQVKGIFSDVVYLDFEGNEGDRTEVDEKDIEPIRITGKWLRQVGFEDGPEDTFVKDCYFFSIENTMLYHDDESAVCFDSMDIEYVHQLQNLFWCLTGSEIEFKQ